MPQAQTHKTVTYPAPIGGLNVQDSLVAMPATDATVMSNFFSQPYGLQVRLGNVRFAAGLGGSVDTLVSHRTAKPTMPTKIFAFAANNMFDVTDPGSSITRVPLTVPGGITSSKWEAIGISNASGYNTMLYARDNDPIRIDDAGNLVRITYAAGVPGANEIAGVNPNRLIGGCIHQKRMWLIQQDTTKAWYLDPEAISGQAYGFDFGAVFTKGGYLVSLASWTRDSGIGPDDMLVAISSLGEIAIYSGPDPSSVTTFQLKGVFYTGSPLSPRAVATVAGDLLILTQFGLLSMNTAMETSDTIDAMSSAYLSQKIQYLLSNLAMRMPHDFGWDLVHWPDNNMILINVPLGADLELTPQSTLLADEPNDPYSGSGQLVQSTITKGWCPWDNQDAISWIVSDHTLIYGDKSGNVWRAWEGHTDGADQVDATTLNDGEPIEAQCQTAFNFLGNLSSVKHAKLVRPTFIGSSKVPYTIRVNPDFDYVSPFAPGAYAQGSDSLWNHGKWNTAKWKGSVQTQKLWTAVSGIGAAFAVRLLFKTAVPVLWAAYDLMYEDGRNI